MSLNDEIQYTTCAAHPDVILPIPRREAERFFCYRCKQLERAARYREQKNEWLKQRQLGLRVKHPQFAVTEAFTSEFVGITKRVDAAGK